MAALHCSISQPSRAADPSISFKTACRSSSLHGWTGLRANLHLHILPNVRNNPCNASSSTSKKRICLASYKELPVVTLRRILKSPDLYLGPACHDALSAKLIEKAGFSFTFMSGFAVAASRLASPDTGLISYGEMVEQGKNITAAVSIPVIGDGDNGYGNALNIKRTVKGYAQAGFAGILIEDQVTPKACGHTEGRKVVSREEAIMRIRAAVDARREGPHDIVIVARTDARQAVTLEEALWRAQAFADEGADVLFIDALTSKDEMRAFCNVASEVPKMANMLEGGGKTPILTPLELQEVGYKLVAYPLSMIGVSIRAMQDALDALKGGRLPRPSMMPSFMEIKEIVGFNQYYEDAKHYVSYVDPMSSAEKSMISFSSAEESTPCNTPLSIPEIDEEHKQSETEIVTMTEEDNQRSLPGLWSRFLRVVVRANNGKVKLDFRIPAGFLDGLSNIVTGVSGLDLRAAVENSAVNLNGKLESGQQLLDIVDSNGDRFQVFLE